jgi:predicted O-methyltransferase YrrM
MIHALRNKFKALRSQRRFSPIVAAAAFVYRHAKQLKTFALMPVAIPELKSFVSRQQNAGSGVVEPSLDAALDSLHGVIRPLQNRSEIQNLLNLLAGKRPKRILEIGTANGGTLFLFCRIADANAIIVSVDMPGGWFGGGYPRWKGLLYQRFVSAGQKLHLLRADSHSPETLARVQRILGDQKFDFIFIDGDHTYNGVKQDYEMYRQLGAPGCIIGFHDIVANATDPDCEVPRFWNELRAAHRTIEFVENPAQVGAGIGVVLPAGQPD